MAKGTKSTVRKELAQAFPRLTTVQVAALVAHTKLQTFTTGEAVIREGTYANGFFVIVSGQAEVVRFDDANKYVKLRSLEPGDFFGEIGLLTPPRRTATVRAKTRLEVAALRNDQFFALLETSPSTAEAMTLEGAKRASRARPRAKAAAGGSKSRPRTGPRSR